MRHDTTGVIVFKNEVTEKLVKYLLLPDEELSNFTWGLLLLRHIGD